MTTAAYQQTWRAGRLVAGAAAGKRLCTTCTLREAEDGFKRCHTCRTAASQRNRSERSKAATRARCRTPAHRRKRRAYMARYGERRRSLRRANHRANPIAALLEKARMRARAAGIAFSIDASHLTVPESCPLLGIPIVVGSGKASPNSPSIDRIVNARGYVPGNVWIVSRRGNAIKNDATLRELKRVVRALERRGVR